ncbi:hypothetical protein BT69DRAFT_1338732 [Atractiella rhizophila]|nr:hypothetical protein BT69DRAFT_1338732 [Atractiella rhizophila]
MRPLVSLILLNFAPSFVTPFCLRVFYTVSPNSRPKSAPQHQQHVKWARTFLIGVYLLVTLLPSLLSPPGPNYYQLLGLRSDRFVGQGEVRKAYRLAARTNHPDKGGDPKTWLEMGKGVLVLAGDSNSGYTGEDDLAPEGLRWGWERFGPDYIEKVLSSPPEKRPVSRRDNFLKGLRTEVFGFYAVTGFFLFYFGRTASKPTDPNRPSILSWWRPILFLLLLALEFYEIVSPLPSSNFNYQPLSYSRISRWLLPLPHQRINFFRQLFIAANSALGQVGFLWFDLPEDDISMVIREIERLGQSCSTLEAHVEGRWKQDLGGIIRSLEGEKLEVVKERTVDFVCNLRLRRDEEGQRVWNEAVERARSRRERGKTPIPEHESYSLRPLDTNALSLDGRFRTPSPATDEIPSPQAAQASRESPPPLPPLVATPSSLVADKAGYLD